MLKASEEVDRYTSTSVGRFRDTVSGLKEVVHENYNFRKANKKYIKKVFPVTVHKTPNTDKKRDIETESQYYRTKKKYLQRQVMDIEYSDGYL